MERYISEMAGLGNGRAVRRYISRIRQYPPVPSQTVDTRKSMTAGEVVVNRNSSKMNS